MVAFTFTNQTGMTLPDPGVSSQVLTVYGTLGTVTGVSVTLIGLQHGYSSDLDMLLMAPGDGVPFEFWSDIAVSDNLDGDYTITDGGPALPGVSGGQDHLISPGTYRPTAYGETESLASFGIAGYGGIFSPITGATFATSFGGIDANGDWTLYIADDRSTNSGSLDGWQLTVITDSDSADITGTSGNDVIAVTSSGGTGSWTINGGPAVQFSDLTGTLGISGGDGNDLVQGGDEDDIIDGGAGYDTFYGGAGDDSFDAGADGGLMYGGAGADRFYFQPLNSDERAYGGAGDDVFVVHRDASLSTTDGFYGGDGQDTLILNSPGGYIIDFVAQEITIVSLGPDPVIDFQGIEVVYGSYLDEWFYGGDAAEIMYGGHGYHDFYGGGGFDEMYGGSGYDYFYAGEDGALMYGGGLGDTFYLYGGIESEIAHGDGDWDTFRVYGGINATDAYYGGEENRNGGDTVSFYGTQALVIDNRNDTLNLRYGGFETPIDFMSFEMVSGSAYGDVFYGSAAQEHFFGGGGNDYLYGGGSGDDLGEELYGGAGDDFLMLGPSGGLAYGGEGADTLNGRGFYRGQMFYGDSGDDLFNIQDGLGTGNGYYGGEDADTAMFFGSTAVEVDLAAGTARDRGTSASVAFQSIETVHGGEGDDFLAGSAGADTLYGNSGNDSLFGSPGADSLYGGDGNDVVAGGADADVLDGGSGFDLLSYVGSDAAVEIHLGHETASGGHAAGDVISGFENVVGSAHGDRLIGSAQVNLLDGRDGDDLLLGNNGNDTLIGGQGRDVLHGGNHADTFVYRALSDSGVLYAGRDRIQDFLSGTDVVDLSAIDADTGTAGDQAFTLVDGAFTGAAGQLRIWEAGGLTFIEGDVDGNGHADFRIELLGTGLGIGAGDFVL